ncbi:hypothetical protein [Nocardia ninae]|uniref:Uncharacterized protein n=1 Tax=Nocardia ninae NBRC 108245 TaxID=1210091 RepID=A0A511MHT0_9NOCA|nr:hypothetical protein [Nocardia ninae]GEM39648.1 hypothetical protein NN4_41670 [Nocardia ninae NBRC 108245]
MRTHRARYGSSYLTVREHSVEQFASVIEVQRRSDQCVRFVAPLLGILLVLICAFRTIG